MTIYSLDVLLSYLEPICCSMSSSNCCFLTSTIILFSRPFPFSSLFLATFNHLLCFSTPFIWEHCGIQMFISFTVWVFFPSILKVIIFFNAKNPLFSLLQWLNNDAHFSNASIDYGISFASIYWVTMSFYYFSVVYFQLNFTSLME